MISIEVPAEAGPLPLREAASAGDAKALFEVATRYAEGRGLKADMAEAAKWYEKSAELGFAPAQYRIGNMYEKGIGVTRDIAKSRGWYEKAAEKRQRQRHAQSRRALCDGRRRSGRQRRRRDAGSSRPPNSA